MIIVMNHLPRSFARDVKAQSVHLFERNLKEIRIIRNKRKKNKVGHIYNAGCVYYNYL